MKNHHGAASAGGRGDRSIPIDREKSAGSGGEDLPPDSGGFAEDAEQENGQLPVGDETRLWLVRQGFFVLGHVPYGLRVVRERQRRERSHKRVFRTRLEPGDQQEVRIVQLIYELYACQNMPVNHILNSLRAQNIPTRSCDAAWTLQKIERILVDPVYIGATRYREVVRYGAFQPVIEPWIFYAAQSRRHFEKLSKSGSLVQPGIVEPIEGEADE